MVLKFLGFQVLVVVILVLDPEKKQNNQNDQALIYPDSVIVEHCFDCA